MPKFVRVQFTPELIDGFRSKKEIPIHFYNKDGQILIYKKEHASEAEIEALLRFIDQGIFYNIDDSKKLGLGDEAQSSVPAGLTDTRLFSERMATDLSLDTLDIFTQLKDSSISAFQAKKASQRLNQVFEDFEREPNAMTGLLNIIELMRSMDTNHDVELAVKRTVVAMAMKTRGVQARNYKDRQKFQKMVSILMTSALLCDIGGFRMNMPLGEDLTPEEWLYIQNHPFMSYMMLAHEPSIDFRVKRNILCQNRPLREGPPGNNYPKLKWLLAKMISLAEKYQNDKSKAALVQDLLIQIKMLRVEQPYDEDANILCLASEFASLTSDVPWRPAYEPERAVRMIVNNSFFTYTERIVREFLDYVAVSLCGNRMVIKEGDFLVVAARGRDDKTYFEVCQTSHCNRLQSRPGVKRVATIVPEIDATGKMELSRFDPDCLRADPRRAHFELKQDDSRRIIYLVDSEYDGELYYRLREMVR